MEETSEFKPTPGKSEALEEFITELELYLFDPSNMRKVKYNMTKEERDCLKELSKWNKDEMCPRMFRIQDKGSRLVVESKERYRKKMLEYLEDISIFKENEEEQTETNEKRVNNWVKKWDRREQLGSEETEWIACAKTRPAKVYANIKTHKDTWPYRYIISCNNTAIEKLARWVEFHLKSLARQHPTYLKDTKHFLNFIETYNEEQGPFKENELLMVCRDISNFYPSCDTNKCLDAVESLLSTRDIQCPSSECILEAISITMSANSTNFDGRFFTQIDGATIGSPDSGSITDIFGAVHIDKKINDDCPIRTQNYMRYRDDTIDICKDSNQEEQEEITDWMNQNISKDKIKFNIESIGEQVTFLDTKVNVVEVGDETVEKRFLLIPSMYSKDTDTHQYLSPTSCHPEHISRNIPITVVNRCRVNCSDRIKDDKIFKDTLIEYKAYLVKSGYNEEHVNKTFINYAIKKKRKHVLKPECKNKRKKSIDEYRFITDHEPSFPDINKAFRKFKSIIEEDDKLKEVFPKGIKHFKVCERRGSKNIKEILAPSTVTLPSTTVRDKEENEHNQMIGNHPCGTPCAYCDLLGKTEVDHFTSSATGQSFKIRQAINCKSENIIYLVHCTKCNLQGVGHATKFNERISNHFSHIKQKRRTCGIVNHFIDKHSQEWTSNYKENNLFQITGIVKVKNVPSNKKARKKRLEEFEGYWQVKLCTVNPHGLNEINELKECHQKFGTAF